MLLYKIQFYAIITLLSLIIKEEFLMETEPGPAPDYSITVQGMLAAIFTSFNKNQIKYFRRKSNTQILLANLTKNSKKLLSAPQLDNILVDLFSGVSTTDVPGKFSVCLNNLNILRYEPKLKIRCFRLFLSYRKMYMMILKVGY